MNRKAGAGFVERCHAGFFSLSMIKFLNDDRVPISLCEKLDRSYMSCKYFLNYLRKVLGYSLSSELIFINVGFFHIGKLAIRENLIKY